MVVVDLFRGTIRDQTSVLRPILGEPQVTAPRWFIVRAEPQALPGAAEFTWHTYFVGTSPAPGGFLKLPVSDSSYVSDVQSLLDRALLRMPVASTGLPAAICQQFCEDEAQEANTEYEGTIPVHNVAALAVFGMQLQATLSHQAAEPSPILVSLVSQAIGVCCNIHREDVAPDMWIAMHTAVQAFFEQAVSGLAVVACDLCASTPCPYPDTKFSCLFLL